MTLDDTLEHLEFVRISSIFKIEVAPGSTELGFAEWLSTADEVSPMVFVRDAR
jgi:hypothetical protein